MKTLTKIALLGVALAAAPAASAGSAARYLDAQLQPWLERDLGADIQRDAEQYRPRIERDFTGLDAAATEFQARVLAVSLQPWLERDLSTEIRDDAELWLQRKYNHFEIIEAGVPDNLLCLAQ